MLEEIDHVNIVVHDLELMTQFYCDTLGFRVTKSVSISGEWIDAVVGLRGVEADVVYLDPPKGPRLELIQYKQPVSASSRDASFPNAPGLRHLAFRVADIEQLTARLTAADVRINSPIATVPKSQVQYSGGAQKRLVYFRDPEGNLLELCEYKVV